MNRIGRGFSSTGTDGRSRSWPQRSDYAEFALANNEISTLDDHEGAIELHALEFLDWVTKGQTACRFATVLAHQWEVAGWKSLVVTDAVPSGRLADFLDDLLIAHSESAEIVQILFPQITTISSLAALVDTLCLSGGNWYRETILSEDVAVENVGLRWLLPGAEHVAWVVGFGPFELFPVTRRAPFTALLVRTSRHKRSSNLLDRWGRMPVHLADADDLLPTAAARTKLTIATKRDKQLYNDQRSLHSARARVTFPLPASLLHSPSEHD